MSLAYRLGAKISLLAVSICAEEAADISNIANLDELSQAINNGGNAKIAFLSKANFDAVHTVLPSTVVPIYCDGSVTVGVGVGCDSVGKLIDLITSDQVIAGLISGLPDTTHAPKLNSFTSTVISTRAMLMAPSQSDDMPHGTSDETKSSYHLSTAVDAAITELQRSGKDEDVRQANMPFEFMAVHTCKGSDSSAFGVPNFADAKGLLRTALDTKVLKIGALGPYDWGGNDGNYKVTPYKGFYPDWLSVFCESFNALKGPNGVAYNAAGEISCTRVWQLGSASVFKDLFDGNSHVTEPYYIVDGFYTGTGEDCSSSPNVCRPAVLSSGVQGKETCTEGTCAHPKSPRTRHFRLSCTTIGVDSTFMTKKIDPVVAAAARQASTTNTEDDGASLIAIIVAVVCGIGACLLSMFVCVIIKREKSGQPIFMKLTAGEGGGGGTAYGNSA